MKILNKIDKFLNSITMYRLVLYGLSVLALFSFAFSLFGIIHYSFSSLLLSLIFLISICYLTNFLFSKIFKARVNIESTFISAFILFFIISPAQTSNDIKIIFIAGIIAMASKYLIAYKTKHIFNPVGISAVIISLFGSGNVIWWVGSKFLLPIVLIVSLLIVRRIRRFSMFLSFVAISISVMTAIQYMRGFGNISDLLFQNIFSWPTIFFAGIMFTEPLTTPPTQKLKITYAILVALLFSTPYNFGVISSSPEMALILANLAFYLYKPKKKLILSLIEKKEIAKDIFEFSFRPNDIVHFKAGQYFEWTLEHSGADNRGERRYFTIASSPTEKDIKIGVKFNPNSSSFKNSLLALKINDGISVGSLDGDFILPQDKNKKLVFIAGGIGVTPFRSMIKYMIDTKEKRSVTLFYSVKSPEEIAYRDIFEQAEKEFDFKVVYIVSENSALDWSGETGYITQEMLKKYVPDYTNRDFYMSGPGAMVDAYKKMVREMGINNKHIHTDYFPGF